MIRIALLLLGCVMLAGCATSKYLQTYVPEGDAAQPGAAAQTAADYKPKVRRSKELDADIADLREEGYIVLGSYGGTNPTAGASRSQSNTKQVDLYRQQAVFLKRVK